VLLVYTSLAFSLLLCISEETSKEERKRDAKKKRSERERERKKIEENRRI